MTTGSQDANAGPDRFATMDEIQSALPLLPDVFIPCMTDELWEVQSDLGGYVLMDRETEDASILALVETLDVTAN